LKNYKFVSECFTICTYGHPCPKTSHRIRKNSQTTLHGKKREETFRRATEEDPSPGWTGAIYVMCTEGLHCVLGDKGANHPVQQCGSLRNKYIQGCDMNIILVYAFIAVLGFFTGVIDMAITYRI